ncbi:MAG: hypothetical protein IT195_03815 [Microthrixaceae bacterium]|nr:hypothetical protein [Microthrixaceae bacterium]
MRAPSGDCLSFNVRRTDGAHGGHRIVGKTAADDRAQAQLDRERDVLRHLRHPNVIELVDGEVGTSLLSIDAGESNLATRPPSGIVEVTSTLALLSRVVAEIHAAGWAHRNLTAEHVIRGDRDTLALCSFRRATEIDRVDAPAAAEDLDAIVKLARAWRDVPVATAHERGLARRLTRILDQAEEPATVAELADHLDRLCAGSPRRPATVAPRRAKRPRRRRVPAAGRRGRHARPRSPVPGLVFRSLLCAAIATWLLRSALAAADAPINSSNPTETARNLLVSATFLLAGYATLLNTVALVGRVSRSNRLTRIVEKAAPSWLRRWITGLAVVGATVTTVASPSPSSEPVSITAFATPTTGPTSTTTTTTATTTTPTTTLPSPPASEPSAPQPPAVVPVAPTQSTLTYTLRPGDHLWSVAERALEMGLGRAPANREVNRYWRHLVEVNRGSLVDPNVPDLVFAGQVITLPPVQ